MAGDGWTFGSEHVGPFPFVQPGAPTSPFAFDQPPAYHAQSTVASFSSSPIVRFESGGSLAPKAPNGRSVGCIVFTAKSPQARPATGDGRRVKRLGPRHPVGVDERVQRVRRARILRRRGRDQPLMVEERAAERGL